MPPDEDAELLAAHARRDAGALVRIYRDAADGAEALGRIDRACFHLTEAYVWALEAGLEEAAALHARLKARGREE